MQKSIIEKMDEVIQKLPTEEYVSILQKEPITKLKKTRNGYLYRIVILSQRVATQFQGYLDQLKTFGDVKYSEGNFVFSIDIYNIDRFDLRNFLSLVDRIKDRIRMN